LTWADNENQLKRTKNQTDKIANEKAKGAKWTHNNAIELQKARRTLEYSLSTIRAKAQTVSAGRASCSRQSIKGLLKTNYVKSSNGEAGIQAKWKESKPRHANARRARLARSGRAKLTR